MAHRAGVVSDVGSPGRGSAYALLALGVVSVGAAAILVRGAVAPALVVAFWRTLIGGAALLAIVIATKRKLPHGEHRTRAIIAGVLLAVHFWTWIASLSLTTVTASVVLVCTQPLFVVVLAALFLRERTSRRAMFGIVVALVGSALIARDAPGGTASMAGNALAVAGAIAIAIYVLVGRKSTAHVDVLAYSAVVSLVAATTLAVPLMFSNDPFLPASSTSWAFIIALAVGPQLVGHTALNAALARLPAHVVSGSILGEPIIASALAFVILGERVGMSTIAGSAVVLVGLYLLVKPAPT